jgi:hypothetical protein
MNAYEIADELDGRLDHKAANMLRKQADRIAELSKNVDELEEELLKTPQIKELSDEEIYKLAGKFWIEGSFDDGELDYVGFARAILKKASFTCNGFCGEQECKENQDDCKRIKKASEK